MGTTPTREAVITGIVSALQAIEKDGTNGFGYTYNLTPEKVMRIPVFEGFRAFLSAGEKGPYYFVRDDGEEIPGIVTEEGRQGWATDVPVVVAYRDDRTEKDPFRDAVSTGIVQGQMVGDVIACLTGDERRGTSAVYRTTVQRVDRDGHDVLANWILAWVFFNVEYDSVLGVP